MMMLGHEGELVQRGHQHVQSFERRDGGLQMALGQVKLLDVAGRRGRGREEGRDVCPAMSANRLFSHALQSYEQCHEVKGKKRERKSHGKGVFEDAPAYLLDHHLALLGFGSDIPDFVEEVRNGRLEKTKTKEGGGVPK